MGKAVNRGKNRDFKRSSTETPEEFLFTNGVRQETCSARDSSAKHFQVKSRSSHLHTHEIHPPGIHTHPPVPVPTGQKHLPQPNGKTAMPKHTVSRQPLRKGGRRTRLRSDRTLGTEKTVLWNQKLQFGGKELEEAFKGG